MKRSSMLERANGSPHPILAVSPNFRSIIFLLCQECLQDLPTPLPRCQDMDKNDFKVPMAEDLVIAISHGWPFQAHPDPLGLKAIVMRERIDDIVAAHNAPGDTLIFFDFCSVSQRPFQEGQADRTEEETAAFGQRSMGPPLTPIHPRGKCSTRAGNAATKKESAPPDRDIYCFSNV